MDDTEAHACKYLATLDLGVPVFEPDGNVPPDFLLAGSIAVEVRRLNQHDTSAGSPRGLEEEEIPLLQRMRRLLESFGPPRSGVTWFVHYVYRRPLQPWHVLRPQLEAWLESFAHGQESVALEHNFPGGFSIDFVRASNPLDSFFELGGYSDLDAGGWLIEELATNIELCITDKTAKIAQFRPKYPAWWLLLVDRIGYGLSDSQLERFRDTVSITHSWDRVIVVSALDHMRAFNI